MSYTTTLELVSPNGHQGKSPSLPEFRSGISFDDDVRAASASKLEKANLVLNHGLLIGEMLGIPIRKAQQIIDRVYNQLGSPNGTGPAILRTSEQQWLLMTFSAISSALYRAINTDGTPSQNTFGKVLGNSDLLEMAEDGSLIITHRQLHLSDLQRKLCRLNEFLSFAIGNGEIIKMQ